MAGIIKLTFNPFQENTYVVYGDNGDCWIVDPGCSNAGEEARLKRAIEDKRLKPVRLLLTHAHIDHILGNAFVHETWGLKPWLHEKEMPVFQFAAQAANMWGIPYRQGPEPEGFISESETLELDGQSFDILFTPGHSPGEVCFLNREAGYCVAGDVLFYGSIGRTDLPGGDYDTLIASIERELLTLPDATIIYSGHGPDTNIGQERRQNPFLQ